MQTGITYIADENLKTAFDPIPNGEYKVKITECKYEPTSDGLGTNFNFKYTIQEGKFANRIIFDKVTWSWDEAHQKAVNFGKVQFNNILLSINHTHFNGDTDEFIGGEMIVEIAEREYAGKDGTMKKTTQVNKYKALNTGATPLTNSTPAPQPNTMARPVFGSVPNPFGAR